MTKSSSMPPAMKASVVEVVKRFPTVTFIWKYEDPDDEVGQEAENLVKIKWMPQNDLLNSGLISLFVTHSGMSSTIEASMSGVPLIAIGLRVEQFRNAKMLSRHGSTLVFDKKDLFNAEKFANAILTIVDNPSYVSNARQLAMELHSAPFSPREIFTRQVAFLAKNGPLTKLKSVSLRMSLIQHYFLDFAFLVFVALLLTLVVLLWLVKKALSCLSFTIKRHKKMD